MTEEILDEKIHESELTEDALEKRMRKLEAESARLLNHSNELIKMLIPQKEKAEDVPLPEAVPGSAGPQGSED